MTPGPGHYCCVNCFRDEAIKKFIADRDDKGTCDFCDAEEVPRMTVREVTAFIDEGVARGYEEAAEHIPYDSSEGGYAEEFTTDLIRILHDTEQIFNLEALCVSDAICNAIDAASKYPGPTPLASRAPYDEPPGSEKHMAAWREFCHTIKHENRYTSFLRYGMPAESLFSGSFDGFGQELGEFNFRSLWQDLALVLSDVTTDFSDRDIFRARITPPGMVPAPEDLTSPPGGKARNGRMNPAGISYFYGAEEEATCIAEVRPHIGAQVAIGHFKPLTRLRILDLCGIAAPKSLFDPDYSPVRDGYVLPFLSAFALEIAQPVVPGADVLEYVPTQAFCEFIKNNPAREPVDGIRYRSAMQNGGVCLVLFRGPEISLGPDPWIEFISAKTVRVGAAEYHCEEVKPRAAGGGSGQGDLTPPAGDCPVSNPMKEND